MKKKGKGLGFLLTILLVFSASLGILHGRLLMSKSRTPRRSQKALTLSVQDAMDMLRPLFASRSIVTAAKTAGNFVPDLIKKVTQQILDTELTILTIEDKLAFLLGVATTTDDSDLKNEILSILLENYKEAPLFSIAFQYQFNKAVPVLKEWAAQTDQDQLKKWIFQSYKDALSKDTIKLVEQLANAGIRPDMGQASLLLQHVARENKNPKFVDILVGFKADPNFSNDGKYTTLMLAIYYNADPALIQRLVSFGADPNKVLIPEIGSAKQLAFEKGNYALEKSLYRAKSHKLGG